MLKNRWLALGAVGAMGAGALVFIGGPARVAPNPAAPDRHGQPMAFERNQGQTDPQVKFLARGEGYRAFVTPSGLTLSLEGQPPLTFAPIQANAGATVTGLAPLPGTVNYLKGSEPAGWLTGVPTFAQAQAHDVYPGVDLVYYGSDGQLEYDFLVAPGADAGAIRVAVSGGAPLALDGQGNLVIGAVVQHRPVAYQDGNGGRQPVAADYVLHADNSFSLRLGGYDHARPLVIDPVIAYSTYLGGSAGQGLADDEGDAVATDAAGNAYIVGRTASTDFPATAGLDTTLGASDDAFVTKLSPAGAVLWSTYLGGSAGFEQAFGVAYDVPDAAVYVTGQTTSTDFPATAGLDTTLDGAQDGFVTKLAAATGAPVWSTYLGGGGDETANAIAADASGNAFVTGSTNSSSGIGAGTGFDTTITGAGDAYVIKLLAAGTVGFGAYIGGAGDETGYGIDVDSAGNAYVTGTTSSATLFPLTGAFDPALNGASDAFVVSVTGGGALRYGSYLGGDGDETGFGIAVDGTNVIVTGSTTSATGFPTTGGADTTLGGPSDAFVTKISATPAVIWSTYLGGSGDESGFAVDVDSQGNPHVAGNTTSPDFPLAGAVDATFAGAGEAFATRLSASTSAPTASTFIGGAGNENAFGVAVATDGTIVVGGTDSASGFPLVNAADGTLGGASDAFATKLAYDNAPPVCQLIGVIAGPPKQQQVRVQDTGSGVVELRNFVLVNATVSYPAIPVGGTTSAFVVTATKVNQSLPSTWSFEVVDKDGNVKKCQ